MLFRSVSQSRYRAREWLEVQYEWDIKSAADLRKKVEEFEERAGIKIDDWDRGRIADAVRLVLANRHLNAYAALNELKGSLSRIMDKVEEELKTTNLPITESYGKT